MSGMGWDSGEGWELGVRKRLERGLGRHDARQNAALFELIHERMERTIDGHL